MENYGDVDGELWRSRWRTMENRGYTMGYPKRSPRISLKISLNIQKSSPRFSELTDILGDPWRHQDILGYLCGANSQMTHLCFYLQKMQNHTEYEFQNWSYPGGKARFEIFLICMICRICRI
jgi:hypothetical protein